MYCIIILIVVHSFPFSLPEDKGKHIPSRQKI